MNRRVVCKREEDSIPGDADFKKCAVCGDRSSGRHYGVLSCEGCKSFFKRCVRNKSTFVCKERGGCEINQQRRTQCQSCRLFRCLQTGMKREAVQMLKIPANPVSSSQVHTNGTSNQHSDLIFTMNRLEELLSEQFPPTLASLDFNFPEQRHKFSLHALRAIVQWGCQLASQTGISPYDSTVLVEQTWRQVFLLTVSNYLPQMNKEARPHINNTTFGRLTSEKQVLVAVERLKSLCIDRIELMCLRALLFLNADVPRLTNAPFVETIQNKYLCTLEDYIDTRNSKVHGTNLKQVHKTRCGRLLVRLLSVNSCTDSSIASAFLPMLWNEYSTVEDLIRDIINNKQFLINY